jgi:signal transduction histidine kinase
MGSDARAGFILTVPRAGTRYGVAIAAALAGITVRYLMSPEWGRDLPFIPLFPAIALSAWFGGFGTGALTTCLSAAGAAYLWLPSTRGGHAPSLPDALGLLLFCSSGVFISFLSDRLQAAQRRAEYTAEEARRVNHAKDEFLATIAHELRQPVHAILPAMELLVRQLSPESTVRAGRTMDVLQRQHDYLRTLIDDLLDASQIVQGRITLHRVPVNVADVLGEAIETIRPRALQRQQSLLVDISTSHARLEADWTRLQQVFVNVLTNAVTYTPPAGVINVSMKADDGVAWISVQDSGCGIPKSDLPHIFDLFRRADGNRERGFGIGLAVTRQLLHLHGGGIEVRSPGPGMGSEFIITLPLDRPSA